MYFGVVVATVVGAVEGSVGGAVSGIVFVLGRIFSTVRSFVTSPNYTNYMKYLDNTLTLPEVEGAVEGRVDGVADGSSVAGAPHSIRELRRRRRMKRRPPMIVE